MLHLGPEEPTATTAWHPVRYRQKGYKQAGFEFDVGEFEEVVVDCCSGEQEPCLILRVFLRFPLSSD